jgi:hypothetical protein
VPLPRCWRCSTASISTPTLQCAGVLARALRGAWRPHMRGLVEPMIMTGLTDALVRALRVSLRHFRAASAALQLTAGRVA